MANEKKKAFNAEDLKLVLRQQERGRLKSELQLIEEQQQQHLAKVRRIYYGIGAVAAAAAIALLIIFMGLPRFAPSPGDLFAQYFEPTSNILSPITHSQENVGSDSAAQRSEIAFGTGTTTAIGAEQQLMADFYEAHDRLKNDQAAAAIPLLLPIAGQDSDFGQAATWYLALAYLKTLDLDQAKPLFREMANDVQHPYQKESRKILKVLVGG